MQVFNAVTIVCLALMGIGLLTVILNLILNKRADRITYIRNFKKGKGALIYIIAIPLFWIGLVFDGQTTLNGFFSAVRRIVDLIVLKYEFSPVQALMGANALYNFTIYFLYILVCLNAIMFALSLASQYLWSYFKNVQFKCSKKDKVVLFGNNEQNYTVYKSEKNRSKIIVDRIKDKQALALYMKNIAYKSVNYFDKYIKSTVNSCVKKDRLIYSIINTGDDEGNIELCRSFINDILKLDKDERAICFSRLKIFVFGDPRYEAIYEDIISDSLGCITYVNKYQKIAIDFIHKYPFSSFMTEEHVDYETSLVKKGVDLNTFFIGFGKTNQQIFLTSVANNQFITKTENGVQLKKVNYHIFDKDEAENNKNLNHNYNRYKNECAGVNAEDYLPLPEYPADERFYKLDVNDMSFYNEIRRVATKSKKSVNFIIIAFGSDLENIDMAQKLVFKCKEWGINNVSILVKVRGEHKGQKLLEEENCYIIGNENEAVYDVENILGDSIFKMAQMRNEVYDLEYELTEDGSRLTDEKINDIKERAYKNWYVKKSQLERDSSIYCCLSLRSKLNLMGLDYCPITKNNLPALTEQEYLEIYAGNDQPDFDYYKAEVEGKPIVHYSLEFKESRRKNLAIHEHLRWNSFMISKGIVPATKKQILEETNDKGGFTNGKNYAVRRHGNITTFDGLVEFRKMVAERDIEKYGSLEKAELAKDVIKYDYQLLDDAFWLLAKNGYKIIKK